jgi:hypothetical protein
MWAQEEDAITTLEAAKYMWTDHTVQAVTKDKTIT